MDKSPAKAVSDMGQGLTAGSFSNILPNPADSMSSQVTQQLIARKVTHKTPQIKPSMPGLAMQSNTIPDNYSNDDKTNEVFALPLAGQRRKASEAGHSRAPSQAAKRQHLQNSSHKKASRDIGIYDLEMKKSQSAM